MTTETFRRADHRPVPTSAHEAEASAVALRAPSEASASCCFPLDITHSPSRRRLSKEIVGRGRPRSWRTRVHTDLRPERGCEAALRAYWRTPVSARPPSSAPRWESRMTVPSARSTLLKRPTSAPVLACQTYSVTTSPGWTVVLVQPMS